MAWAAGGVVKVATRPAGAAEWSAPAAASAPGAGGVIGLVVDPTGVAGLLWSVPAGGRPAR